MGRMKRIFGRFHWSEQGGVAVACALALLPLTAGFALAVDYARMANVRADMQGALEATARFLLRESARLEGPALEIEARRFFKANFYGLGITRLDGLDIEKDRATKTLTLAVSGRVEAATGLFSYETIPVEAGIRVACERCD